MVVKEIFLISLRQLHLIVDRTQDLSDGCFSGTIEDLIGTFLSLGFKHNHIVTV